MLRLMLRRRMQGHTIPACPRQLLPIPLAIASDIKLAHSVFALPFALLGAVIALEPRLHGVDPINVMVLAKLIVLIVICMVAARTYAMTLNRLLDAAVDARNPRTTGRALPAGRVSRRQMFWAAAVSGLVLVGGAAGFWVWRGNPWPVIASPVVLVVLGIYPLTKRVTWLCHVVLGFALALSPVAAALAIDPVSLAAWPVWMLAAAVMTWVAGFDILYAMQDVEVDRREALHSIPARLGVPAALWISRALHVIAAACFALVGVTSPGLGTAYLTAVVITGGVLVLEHILTAAGRTDALPLAFGTLNGLIAVLLGSVGIVDLLMFTSS